MGHPDDLSYAVILSAAKNLSSLFRSDTKEGSSFARMSTLARFAVEEVAPDVWAAPSTLARKQ
jgi:hypothetical protein